MAIDTQAKRLSAISTRRLPWMRRFIPQPGGGVDQGDRQQVAFVYRGIAAAEPEEIPVIDPWTRQGSDRLWKRMALDTSWTRQASDRAWRKKR